MALPVLQVEDLSVFGGRRALVEHASLDVAPGAIHLLVGPNGAGKSTLFAAVLGRVEFAGRIRFHWRGAGRIGYVPQGFAVDPTLPITVTEFLALSRQRRPVCFGIARRTHDRIEALLGLVGLADLMRQPLRALSGGELRRVLVANAIDPAPELLLLDEPASGLDERAVRRLDEILLELRASAGTSVLMVSHDLAQVRRIADRVTLLDGAVRRSGPPADVLADDLTQALADARGVR